MTPERPSEYTLYTKQDGATNEYVYKDEIAWTVSFETGAGSTTITYLPECEGVTLTSVDNPNYDEGKQRAVFGLVLIKLLRTGEMVMTEL